GGAGRDGGGGLGGRVVGRHVRLVPAVGRDHAAIGRGGGIDDGKNVVALIVATAADGHRVTPQPRSFASCIEVRRGRLGRRSLRAKQSSNLKSGLLRRFAPRNDDEQ